jgi:AcrR family transcriptional regulator
MVVTMDPALGLRERTRQAVRAELVQVALGLFLEHGFEATTVEQIATAAGISRRSFHRYFATKDDVLTQALSHIGDKIASELADRPVQEPPWTALRRAFDTLTVSMSEDLRALPLTRIMLTSSGLEAGDSRTSWQIGLAAVLLRRPATVVDDVEHSLQADALAGSAIACMRTAQRAWVESDGNESLARLLDLAMSAVAPLVDY